MYLITIYTDTVYLKTMHPNVLNSSASPISRNGSILFAVLGTLELDWFLPPLQRLRNAVGNASTWLFVTGFVTVSKTSRKPHCSNVPVMDKGVPD